HFEVDAVPVRFLYHVAQRRYVRRGGTHGVGGDIGLDQRHALVRRGGRLESHGDAELAGNVGRRVRGGHDRRRYQFRGRRRNSAYRRTTVLLGCSTAAGADLAPTKLKSRGVHVTSRDSMNSAKARDILAVGDERYQI